jgi:hypothetical protein
MGGIGLTCRSDDDEARLTWATRLARVDFLVDLGALGEATLIGFNGSGVVEEEVDDDETRL